MGLILQRLGQQPGRLFGRSKFAGCRIISHGLGKGGGSMAGLGVGVAFDVAARD